MVQLDATGQTLIGQLPPPPPPQSRLAHINSLIV